RRYFYPSLNKLPYIEERVKMKNSEEIAERILCLPLYSKLSDEQVKVISEIINKNQY
ncbi:MAG: DegT/DnrJ/EryC1/StrS family aminotransferase, partial [Flavobacteriaceae bacterium]|nr:DegT/DnrJ/EryC1/StrS family aminotransferase [Flavobacteriaceae bacterium]